MWMVSSGTGLYWAAYLASWVNCEEEATVYHDIYEAHSVAADVGGVVIGTAKYYGIACC